MTAKIFIIMNALLATQSLMAQSLSEMITKARTKFGLPALAVVTFDSSRILESAVEGTRVWNKEDKVTLDHFFHTGSCGKSVLSVIAAKLIGENKIRWDSKFFDVLPELKPGALPAYANITLEDLILCKAGIQPFTDGSREKFPEIDPAAKRPRYDFAKWLLALPPASKLKSRTFQFRYSNAGYTLAALMLETVSGKTFEELVRNFIAEEMGVETFFGFPNKKDVLQPWGHLIRGKVYEVFPPDHEYEIPYLILPAGDLSMTPLGFAEYIQHHLKGIVAGDELLSTENYRHIHYAQKGFALGVYNTRMYGKPLSGMDGSAGTFFCRAIIMPEDNFAFVIMTNAGTGKARMKAIDWTFRKILKKRFNWWWKIWM